MIRSEKEYQNVLDRLEKERELIEKQKKHFKELGHTEEEIERLLQPMISFHSQLEEEVEAYDEMKRGNLGTLYDFVNIGRWLIGVRIALGLSQKEFAEELGVSEAQVSRDENNEYHGITVEKANRILNTFHVQFRAEIDKPVRRPRETKKVEQDLFA